MNFRHYKQLIPRFEQHRQDLEKWNKAFWQFYRKLAAYRAQARYGRGSRFAGGI